MPYLIYQTLWRIALLWLHFPMVQDPKIRARIKGLKEQQLGLAAYKADAGPGKFSSTQKKLLFHFASLGEWEQGRSLLEAWHKLHPGDLLYVSFFSASGYQQVRLPEYVRDKFYLPWDLRSHMDRFIKALRPDAVFIVKYELWPAWFRVMQAHKIPFFLYSARFNAQHWLFKWWAGFARTALKAAKIIFVQDETSARLLRQHGIEQVEVAGDTRADRVLQLSKGTALPDSIRTWAGNAPVLVAGSTWPKDEELWARVWLQLPPEYKLILVPHEWQQERMPWYQDQFGNCSLWSALKASRVLLVDQVGWLSQLYSLADWVYVGGGFGAGIHNILEPAVWAKPVVFGPRYQRFDEAHALLARGAAQSVNNAHELLTWAQTWQKSANRESAGAAARKYVEESAGATERILGSISRSF